MKRTLLITMTCISLAGCGHPATLNGVYYPTHGFLDKDTKKSEKVCYELSVGNVVWSVLTLTSIVLPVYFVGFSLYNPVRLKTASGGCGMDDQ